jgi:cytidine diphosphoramidate kinase
MKPPACHSSGRVVWITGLSGAGKSTIARQLVDRLKADGEPPILLDGDEVRTVVADPQVAHDRASRLTNAMRICRLTKLIADQGFTVVVATMSLFKEVHAWNRQNLPGYFEVYVRVSFPVLEQRDARNLYSRARQGLAQDVVGIHVEFDAPQNPELILDNEGNANSIAVLAQALIDRLDSHNKTGSPGREPQLYPGA